MYRETAIKRQMEHLQKELDEMHPENVSDIQQLENKVEESGMNETALKEATKVLNRLKQDGGQGAESGMLYDYLDFLTGLSWKKAERLAAFPEPYVTTAIEWTLAAIASFPRTTA